MILAQCSDVFSVVAFFALAGFVGAFCLLGALTNFLSKEEYDSKLAIILLVIGLVCFVPALLFLLACLRAW
jgi:uncharacterized membrane protein YdfJ with MMPL/SSD domain